MKYFISTKQILREKYPLNKWSRGKARQSWDAYVVDAFTIFKRKKLDTEIIFTPIKKGKKDQLLTPPLFVMKNGNLEKADVIWKHDFESDETVKVSILDYQLYDNPLSTEYEDKLAKISIDHKYFENSNEPFYFIPIKYLQAPNDYVDNLRRQFKKSPENIENYEPEKSLFKTHTKDITPSSLGFTDKKFSNKEEMADFLIKSIQSKYSFDENFVNYIRILTTSIITSSVSDISNATINFENDKDISSNKKDYNVISKNLGEVLSALYILTHRKDVEYVYFPDQSNQALYDFIFVTKDKKEILVSVKTKESSGTSFVGVNKGIKNEEKYNFSALNALPINDKAKKSLEIMVDPTITSFKKYLILFNLNFPELFDQFTYGLQKIVYENESQIVGKEVFWTDDYLKQWYNDLKVKFVNSMDFINKLSNLLQSTMKFKLKDQTKSTIQSVINQDLENKNAIPYFLAYFLGRYTVAIFNQNFDYIAGLNALIKNSQNLSFIYTFVECKKNSFSIKMFSSQSDVVYYSYDLNTLVNNPSNRSFSFKVQEKDKLKKSSIMYKILMQMENQ